MSVTNTASPSLLRQNHQPTPVPLFASTGVHGRAVMLDPLPAVRMPAVGQAGPSNWLEAQRRSYPNIGRKVPLRPRAQPSDAPLYERASVIDSNGMFNGSCLSTQHQSTSIEVPEGSCASFFPDITAYCCSGIQGSLMELPSRVNTSSSDSASRTAINEPACRTTKYSDALACFRITAETNCKTGQSGPYGLCATAGSDTSTVTMQQEQSAQTQTLSATSGAASSSSSRGFGGAGAGAWKKQVLAVSLAVLSCLALQS